MKLTRAQLEQLHAHMQDLAGHTYDQENITKKNIIGTNRVIYIFTALGFVITLFIFFMFYKLSSEIEHSVVSMQTMQNQVVTFQKTVTSLTNTIENMGIDVEQLYYMNNSIAQIANQTQVFEDYLGDIATYSQKLSSDSRVLNMSSKKMNITMNHLTKSTGRIAYSLNETAKPIRQFIPIP